MGVGYTSLFYEAVGIATSKDNFATYDRTQVIVALLSMGPVGPSDAINWLSNRSDWVKSTCNSEGVLLKPSTPIRTIDAKFNLDPAGHTVPLASEVWASSSTVTGPGINYTTHIVLALTLGKHGFTLWRNDTLPRMDGDAEYVYRVHPAGYGLPPNAGPCANGSTIEANPNPAPKPKPGPAPAPENAEEREQLGTTAQRRRSAPKCVVQQGRDIASGTAAVATPGHPNTIANATHDECCAACYDSSSCTAWIFGPLNGVDTCFLAMNVRGTNPVADRDFCCMDTSTRATAPVPTCVTAVPVAGVPLSVESPGDTNCSAVPGNSPTNGHDELVTVYPTVHGFVLLGELGKWVTVSPNRFFNLAITTDTLSVDLRGGVGELCTVTVVVDGTVVVRDVRIGLANVATLTVRKHT